MRSEHWDKSKTIALMSEESGLSRITITRWMERLGVPHRSISEDNKRRYASGWKAHTKEAHARLRELEKNPEWKWNRQEAIRLSQQYKPSSIEIMVQMELERRGIHFIPQKRMGHYFIDFYIPETKTCIECDGTYWHSPEKNNGRDARKDNWLRTHGQRIIRLTEKEIKTDVYKAVDKCSP
jgi:very-short-patch-repair endonuclease